MTAGGCFCLPGLPVAACPIDEHRIQAEMARLRAVGERPRVSWSTLEVTVDGVPVHGIRSIDFEAEAGEFPVTIGRTSGTEDVAGEFVRDVARALAGEPEDGCE